MGQPDVVEPRTEIRLLDAGAIFFTSLITGTFGVLLGTELGGPGSFIETCASLVGLWCGLIPGTYLVCRLRATGNLVEDLGLKFKLPSDLRGILFGLGSQFLLLPIVYTVIQLFSSRDLSEDLEKPARDLTNNANGPGFWLLAVLLIIGAPLVEEIFYRGVVFLSLKRSMTPNVAILVSGVIFGVVHFNVLTMPGLAVFGVVLAWLAHRSGRLGPSILAHAAFNAATVILLWNG